MAATTTATMTMVTCFEFNTSHRVVVCRECATCVGPGRAGLVRHARREPHRLKGDTLKALIAYLSTLDLRPLEELREGKAADGGVAIEHLTVYDGYRCLLCSSNGPGASAAGDGGDGTIRRYGKEGDKTEEGDNAEANDNAEEGDNRRAGGCRRRGPFCSVHLPSIGRHVSAWHGRMPSEHSDTKPLWEVCSLQTYFTAKGLIDYFVVAAPVAAEAAGEGRPRLESDSHGEDVEAELFARLEDDCADIRMQTEKGRQGGTVENFGLKVARVPWLERVGFPAYLAGLRDAEIKSSYQLPKAKLGLRDHDEGGANASGGRREEDDGNIEADIARICDAAEELLSSAYKLCSDTSSERKMTQQRANILSEFYAGASGRAEGFRYYKNPLTLKKYFRTCKQLLAYYYRVVHCDRQHFTPALPGQSLPGEAIRLTPSQRQAAHNVVSAVHDNDGLALKDAIRQLYLALICHITGSAPFRSPVLSYCAMLSRRGSGIWEEPGNFNSHLSALTWTAQLLIFEAACFHERGDEDQVPIFLRTVCGDFFQQLAETPFGHILQWRLYLFKVGKAAVARHQARWYLDGQTVVYRGLELQMSQVSGLVVSEYKQAQALLYGELMFGACDLMKMQAWRLQDDLDADGVDLSWLDHPGNTALVAGANLALLRHIWATATLRSVFIADNANTKVDAGASLSDKAISIYEASAQELLRRLLVLCHITSGQPLREPELLSVTCRNTTRPRHIFLWERLVMIHTQYHKGQQQSGVYRENIRFLPAAVGNLLLDYIAYVLPLRQLFLWQQTPQRLISPYLWATLGGSVWPDGTLSLALSKACARAQVPRLHTANWRQISVSICKEKFSTRDRAIFDLEGAGTEEEALIEEGEQVLADMARQSNHSYRTFNQGYAGSTTLTTNALMHRGYRASECWREFFGFDKKLQGKRRHSDSSDLPLPELNVWKRSQVRRRATYSESDLVVVARRLLRAPDIRLRAPGQRDGLLALMGPRAAEQVVLVLGTGSGKSLIFMVGASVADAQTTILVLPTVALRQEMLRRCLQAGIRLVVWSDGCEGVAPLVIVSAEAACTARFLEYAQQLIGRQQLDRVVIDECHLTVTASDYRPCMSQLAWHIRQLRTQSVWLTATLPPVMEREFVEHNKLVKPRIIRESTNRPNIKYMVSLEAGPGSLIEKATGLMVSFWSHWDIFDPSCDKAIIYCRTCAEASELAALIGCPAYTSRCGNQEEKAAIITRWLKEGEHPVIAATSALGVGFDYPSVRWVVHVGAPRKLTHFSQESGRAGRDGRKALSIILLQADWEPEASACLSPDEQSMQLFLTQKHCSRGVLSQFLDAPSDWRWCMPGEEPCQVCHKPRKEARPVGMVFVLPAAEATEFTGPAEVLRLDHLRDKALDGYEKNLNIVVGSCTQCRVGGRKFDHTAGQCSHRFEWIRAKEKAYRARQKEGRQWIERYIVCWHCYQPQEICRVADPEHEETACRYPDIVMPLCYGVYHRPGGISWLQKQLRQSVPGGLEDYMLWLGQTSSLEGNKCIRANCIAAVVLEDLLR